MEYRDWIYVLVVVFFLLLLSLLFLIKKLSKKPQEDTTSNKQEKSEYPSSPIFKGVNLRENFRVDLTDVNCFVEFLDVDNEELDPKFFSGILRNISVGGVKFVCDYEFPIEDDMEIKIRFNLKESMFIVRGLIVRKELYPDRDRFGYGVKFTNLLDEDRELLYQILNRIMLEKRRKTVGKGLVGEESMV